MKSFVFKLIVILSIVPTTLFCSLPIVRYGLAERNAYRNMSGYPDRVEMRYNQMADRSFASAWQEDGKTYYMFGVFDGNGGYQVSDYLKNNFVTTFKTQDADTVSDKLTQTFNRLEEAIQEDVPGSMAAIVLLEHSDTGNYLYTAHVGDSRIGIKINDQDVVYTQDHTTRNESEVQRIKQINSEKLVTKTDGSIELCGSLYTRIMGKRVKKTQEECQGLLIAEPEISFYNFNNNRSNEIRICLASDGLWERIDAQDEEYIKTKQALGNFFNPPQPSRRARYTQYVRQLFGRAYSKIKRLFRKKNIELIRPEEGSQKITGTILENTDPHAIISYHLYQRSAGNDLLRAQAKNLVDTVYNEFLYYQKQGVRDRFDDTSVILVDITIPERLPE